MTGELNLCICTGSGRKTWRYESYNKMKSILSFNLNLLLKLSLSESILITIFFSCIECLWGGVPCCEHIPASVSRYSMVVQIAATSSLVFCFKSTIVPSFIFYTLLLSYPQSKKSRASRSCDFSGHSIFPLREITRAENIALRTRIAVLAVWVVAPSCWNQRVWFSTPSLCDSGSRNVRSILV